MNTNFTMNYDRLLKQWMVQIVIFRQRLHERIKCICCKEHTLWRTLLRTPHSCRMRCVGFCLQWSQKKALASLVYFYNGRHDIRYNRRILCTRVDSCSQLELQLIIYLCTVVLCMSMYGLIDDDEILPFKKLEL
jgi:hypothetical protein